MSTNTIYTNILKTSSQFIEEAYIIHGSKYNYSKVKYSGRKHKVDIICPKHGIFDITPEKHLLRKQGCRKCGMERSLERKRIKSYNKFINDSSIIHNNKYDYSKVEFIKLKGKVKIICPIHGSYNQIAYDHMKGTGCSKCFFENKKSAWHTSKDSVNADRISYMYNIKLTNKDEVFYKYGITYDLNKRFRRIKLESGYKVDIVNLIIDTRYNCDKLEQKLLKNIKSKGRCYRPKLYFGGYTECFI